MSRRTKKAKLSPASRPIEHYFTPVKRFESNLKRKANDQNVQNSASPKKKHRPNNKMAAALSRRASYAKGVLKDTNTQAGSAESSPLNESTPRNSSLQPQASSSSSFSCKLQSSLRTTSLGLTRIRNSKYNDRNPTMDADYTFRELHEGDILGRDSNNHQVGLNIPLKDYGVSRKQLTVQTIDKERRRVKFLVSPHASNSVSVVKFRPTASGKVSRTQDFIGMGEDFTMHVGDIIEFDAFHRQQNKKVEHVFRLFSTPRVEAGHSGTRAENHHQIQRAAENANPLRAAQFSPKPSKLDRMILVDTMNTNTQPVVQTSEISEEKKSPVIEKLLSDEHVSNDIVETGNTASTTQSSEISPEKKPLDRSPILEENPPRETEKVDGINELKSSVKIVGLNSQPEKLDGQTTHESCKAVDLMAAKDSSIASLIDEKTELVEKEETILADSAIPETAKVLSAETENKFMTHNQLMTHNHTRNTKASETEAETNGSETQVVLHTESIEKTTILGGRFQCSVPKIGDRFRVAFRKVENMFGKTSFGWFFGTATMVKKNSPKAKHRYTVDILYDDTTPETGIHFPTNRCQLLVKDETPGRSSIMLAEVRSNKHEQFVTREVAYEMIADPLSHGLELGDLVECRYQNGLFNGAWYRGRIAHINKANTHVDIAYDDKEYEQNIPIEPENLRIVEQSASDTKWLLGLAFKSLHNGRTGKIVKISFEKKSSGSQAKSPVGKSDMDSTASLKVHVKISQKIKTFTYSDVVRDLFWGHYQKCYDGRKVKEWPTLRETDCGKVSNSVGDTSNGNCESSSPKPNQTQQAEKNVEAWKPSENFQVILPLRVDSGEISPSETQPLQPPKLIHASLASVLWRALNSTEPHNGAQMLSHVVSVHNTIANDHLERNMLDFMKSGPKSEGTAFPDPNRMELVLQQAARQIHSRTSVGDIFSVLCWDDVETILGLLAGKIYATTSDAECPSSDVLLTAQSLQVAACSLEFIETLLDADLGKFIFGDSVEFRSSSICRAILKCNMSFREALKTAVRRCIQCWVQNGHWVIESTTEVDEADLNLHQSCHVQSQRCVDGLGKIVSYLAWVYCKDEKVSIGHKDCSLLIKEVILGELRDIDLVQVRGSKSKAAKKSFTSDLKASFILSLDDRFASSLQASLSKLLGG